MEFQALRLTFMSGLHSIWCRQVSWYYYVKSMHIKFMKEKTNSVSVSQMTAYMFGFS